ncbi:MAG: MurT ligase domain-containing protein [Actinomycetia bacterium]|nr:MurT ligase domain-containing protein [Actinomycetes bacterium]
MLRTTAAVIAGKAARAASRVKGGGGSAFPGLVAERVDPKFLAHALAGVTQGIVVVTGTNGKTTTTRMLVAILRAHGKRVLTNPTGSNFTRGVISSMLKDLPLSGRAEADIAVLELDEAHALKFTEVVTPTHALLLNVARDQLDRFAEIDHTARLLQTLAAQATDGVVLNIDDPYVARSREVVQDSAQVRYFGLDESIAHRLPEILEADVRFDEDYQAPDPGPGTGLLRPIDEREFEVLIEGGEPVGPLTLQQRGLAAMINAAAATTMAREVLGEGFSPALTATALRELRPPFGRGEVVEIDGHPLELVLVKNPAGFTVALSTYGTTPVATMIAINDQPADGRDVSWLYDVSFESLRERGVAMASGVRAYDMALRLAYDDVHVSHIEPALIPALDQFLAEHPDEPRRLFCTYTAMMTLRRTLAARHDLPEFGEEAGDG